MESCQPIKRLKDENKDVARSYALRRHLAFYVTLTLQNTSQQLHNLGALSCKL
jgi:hypothetical protein